MPIFILIVVHGMILRSTVFFAEQRLKLPIIMYPWAYGGVTAHSVVTTHNTRAALQWVVSHDAGLACQGVTTL